MTPEDLRARLVAATHALLRNEADHHGVMHQCIYRLVAALASGDRAAASLAAAGLCEAEYDATGDCEAYGRVVDALIDDGTIDDLELKA